MSLVDRAVIIAQRETEQVTLRLRSDVAEYFKRKAKEHGISWNALVANTIELLAEQEWSECRERE